MGMLMETLGCSEQLDPFCGSLIIEHLLMAWMFQQQGRLLVAVRLSFAVLTHVAVSMHTRVLKYVSVDCSFVCLLRCICVCLRAYDLVCTFQPAYVRVDCMCPLMHGYVFVRMPVCLRTH